MSDRQQTTPPPKVIHYTLGDLKPWNWWAVAVLPDVAWLWWQKYARLAPASDSSNRTALMVAAPILFYIAVAFADPREVRLFRLFSPLYRLAAGAPPIGERLCASNVQCRVLRV